MFKRLADQSLDKSIDSLSLDSSKNSEHNFKYSSMEGLAGKQSMEFQMRESMIKYNKHLPTMEKIVKLD